MSPERLKELTALVQNIRDANLYRAKYGPGRLTLFDAAADGLEELLAEIERLRSEVELSGRYGY